MAEKPSEFSFAIVNNATVSVDTFFLISGFLLAYIFFKRTAAKVSAYRLPSRAQRKTL